MGRFTSRVAAGIAPRLRRLLRAVYIRSRPGVGFVPRVARSRASGRGARGGACARARGRFELQARAWRRAGGRPPADQPAGAGAGAPALNQCIAGRRQRLRNPWRVRIPLHHQQATAWADAYGRRATLTSCSGGIPTSSPSNSARPCVSLTAASPSAVERSENSVPARREKGQSPNQLRRAHPLPRRSWRSRRWTPTRGVRRDPGDQARVRFAHRDRLCGPGPAARRRVRPVTRVREQQQTSCPTR